MIWPNCYRFWKKRSRNRPGWDNWARKLRTLEGSQKDTVYRHRSVTYSSVNTTASEQILDVLCQESWSLGKIRMKWNNLKQISKIFPLLPLNIFMDGSAWSPNMQLPNSLANMIEWYQRDKNLVALCSRTCMDDSFESWPVGDHMAWYGHNHLHPEVL